MLLPLFVMVSVADVTWPIVTVPKARLPLRPMTRVALGADAMTKVASPDVAPLPQLFSARTRVK